MITTFISWGDTCLTLRIINCSFKYVLWYAILFTIYHIRGNESLIIKTFKRLTGPTSCLFFSSRLAIRSERHIIWWDSSKRGGEHEDEASRRIKTNPLVQMDGIPSISGQQVIAPPPSMIHHCHHFVNGKVFFPGLRTFNFCSRFFMENSGQFLYKDFAS